MVRAAGSYPAGRWFESDRRYQRRKRRKEIRPHGQAVKTSPFHGGNGSSILPGVTKREHSSAGRALALQARCHRFEPCNSHFFYGGVAQLARARGSYPRCRGFKSLLRYIFLPQYNVLCFLLYREFWRCLYANWYGI